GLCLPRSSVATSVASRPSTTSSASITCQARVTSPGLGLYVGKGLPRRQHCVWVLCGPSADAPQRTTTYEDTPMPTAPVQRGGYLAAVSRAPAGLYPPFRWNRPCPAPRHA